jgi:1-acyl-sn-glycerol-3-phosphate acyltransferase
MKPVKKILWLLLNAVQLVITLIWSAVGISAALVVRVLTGSAHIPLRMAAWIWSPVLVYGSLSSFRVMGRDQLDVARPCLYVANHQSMIDICALFMALPFPLRFVLKSQLGSVPFLGWYTRAMGMVQIERSGARANLAALEKVTGLLHDGHSLAAFPEGTRGQESKLKRFKKGIFKAAIKAGVDVVPVAISGTGAIMPPGGFHIRPGHIQVTIGQAISTKGMEIGDSQVIADQSREAIERLLLQ